MMCMDNVVVLMTFCVARMPWTADVDGGERRGLESSSQQKNGASDVCFLIPWSYDFAIACDFWIARVYILRLEMSSDVHIVVAFGADVLHIRGLLGKEDTICRGI